MFEIILLTYLSYRNGMRAKVKGLNTMVWTGLTACAYLAALMMGTFVVISFFCRDISMEELSSLDYQKRMAVSKQLEQIIATNPLHSTTIMMFGIGGYLLIRYILERKPGKKEEELAQPDSVEQ